MKNGNEPAFTAMNEQEIIHGVTKREYFAGLAMQGLLANEKSTKNKSNIFIRFLQLFYPEMNIKWASSNTDDLTISAIKYADELLLQLDKPIPTTEA